ncbi:hypothetical protein ABPG73_004329 [Tetrahymena malaccensis]
MDKQLNQENQTLNQDNSQQNIRNSEQDIEDYSEDISRPSDSEEKQHHFSKQQNCKQRLKKVEYLKKYEDDIIFLKRSLSSRFQKENKQASIEWLKQQIDKVNKAQCLEPDFEILTKTFDSEDQIFEYLHQSNKKLFIQFFVHIDNNLQNSQQLYQKLKESLRISKDRKKEDEHNVISHFKILFEKYHYDYQEFKNAFRKQFPDLYQSARKESHLIKNKTQIKLIKNISKYSSSEEIQSFNQDNSHSDFVEKQNSIFKRLSKERKLSYQVLPQKKQKKINQEFDTSFSTNQQDDFIKQNSVFDEISKANFNSENHSLNQRNNTRDQDCQDSKSNEGYDQQDNLDYGNLQEYQISQAEQRSLNFENNSNDLTNQQNQSEFKHQIQILNKDNTYQIQQLNNQREQHTEIYQKIANQNIINYQFSNSSLNRILRNVPSISNLNENVTQSNFIQNQPNLQNQDLQTYQCLQLRQEQVKQLESNLNFLQQTRKTLSEQLNQLKISLESNYLKFSSQQNLYQTLNSQVLQYDDLIFRQQNNILKKQNQTNTNKFFSQKNQNNNY